MTQDVEVRKCFQCEQENPSIQSFCGSCGAALTFNDFLAKKISEEIAGAVRDRDVLETESAIKVFERAWGWVKIVGGIAALLLAIVGGGVLWKVSDWWSSVDKAKQSVVDTASTTREDIAHAASKSVADIQQASHAATDASQKASQDAVQVSSEVKRTASQTKIELAGEANAVRNDVEASRTELKAASKIQPEMQAMRDQLAAAVTELGAQQKVISSSEEFAKKIFSSHVVDIFDIKDLAGPNYLVVPPVGKGNTLVYLLLPSVPIDGTIQIQYHIFIQPPNSYVAIRNLIIFFWGDPAENLKQKPLSVSYFPDSGDKDVIHSISLHDGRVFADDQPMPKMNQPDPDFKGNKWLHWTPAPAQSNPHP